jgi:dCMP deaminase
MNFCSTLDYQYLSLAWEVAQGSPCQRTKVGCVIVNHIDRSSDNIIMTSCGNDLCRLKECMRPNVKSGESLEYCRGVHAEEKAILLMGKDKCKGLTIYVTHFPCASCARLIAHVGIKQLIYSEDWGNSELSRRILQEGEVIVRRLPYGSNEDSK